MPTLFSVAYLVTFILTVAYGEFEVHNASSPIISRKKEYYCENMPGVEFDLPSNIESINTKKMCRYRDSELYPADVFRWVSGYGCLRYYSPDWFSKKFNTADCVRTIKGVRYVFKVGAVENVAYYFDYRSKKFTNVIESTFKTRAFFSKWETCAKTADSCCLNTMNEQNIHPSDEYQCPAVWDAWSCFRAAKENTISEEPCPDYISSASNAPCVLYSQKECFSNGTWNQQTEYGTCASAPVYRRRHNFHIVALYVSIALSFPAVLIFVSYKNLRILRVNLHRNLLVACIMRNILTIVSKEIAILDSLKPTIESNNVLDENGVSCRVLAYFTSVFTNAIYACMLMDGFYLHKLIVRVFSPDPNVYVMYGVTALLSLLPTTIWAIFVAIQADQYCWMVDSSWYQWIPDGFRIAILCINVILLGDIVRALITKLRKNVSAQHTKSTLKAMSLLIPLFGVPFILTSSRDIVDGDSCLAGDIYYYVSYAIQALQGIMVAVLFCYWNKEVHNQIKGTYKKLRLQYENRLGSANNQNQSVNRRETAATYVHNNNVALRKNNVDKSPVIDPSQRINDWLTENKQEENVGFQRLESRKTNGELQFSEPEAASAHLKTPFNRISRFIDDSNEDVSKANENSDSNLKQQ